MVGSNWVSFLAAEPTNGIKTPLVPVTPEGSSTSRKSNNGRGPPTRDTVSNLCTEEAVAVVALEYPCPGKDRVDGTVMACVPVNQRGGTGLHREELYKNSVQNLRYKFSVNREKAQKLLNYLWEHTPRNLHGNPGLNPYSCSSAWMVGDDRVCTWCWAAQASFLSKTEAGKLTRKGDAFQKAIAAYRKGDLNMPKLNKVHSPAVSSAAYSTCGSGTATSGTKGLHKETIKAWVVKSVKFDAGLAQFLTTDQCYHLQGMTLNMMYMRWCEEIEREHGADFQVPQLRLFQTAVQEINEKPANHGLSGKIKYGKKYSAQAECALCTVLNHLKTSSKQKMDDFRYWERRLALHLEQQQGERFYYNTKIVTAKDKRTGVWSFGADKYGKHGTTIPTFRKKTLGTYKGAAWTTGGEVEASLTGVVAHGIGTFKYIGYWFLSADGNSNIHCIYDVLLKMFDKLEDPEDDTVITPPETLHVQLDGASDNKNLAMLRFFAWLVLSGVVSSATLSFLMVGHTHADYDRQFSALDRQLKTKGKMVRGVSELLQHVMETDRDLVAAEVVSAIPDWATWFGTVGTKLEGIKGLALDTDVDRPHHFLFEKDTAGNVVMNYKNLASDESFWNSQPVVMLTGLPEGEPVLCHPKGDKLLALEKLWDNREKVLSTFNHTTGENLLIPEQFKVELSNVYDILEPSEEEGGAGLRFDHLLCKQKEGSDYLLHRIGETGQHHYHKGYTYRALQPATVMTSAARALLIGSTVTHARGPEPIMHKDSTHSEKEDKATRRVELKANKGKKANFDDVKAKLLEQRTAKGQAGELTTAEVTLLQQYTSEREGAARRVVLARKYSAHETEAVIVGAAKVKNFEEVYLVHYTEQEWASHPKVRLWVCKESLLSFDSITESDAIDRLQVWWTGGGSSVISSECCQHVRLCVMCHTAFPPHLILTFTLFVI